MKIHQLLEAIDPKLQELITKFGLTANKNGSQINDFAFKDEHKKAFDDAGYSLNWDGKKSKFIVKSKDADAAAKAKEDEKFAIKNVTGRVDGFKPRRKMK